jgi:hypothetical protein
VDALSFAPDHFALQQHPSDQLELLIDEYDVRNLELGRTCAGSPEGQIARVEAERPVAKLLEYSLPKVKQHISL